jgi:hypothetical protein
LVAVLAFMVIGMWLATQLLQRIEHETRRNPSVHTQDELKIAAYQTLELTMAVLEEIRTLDQGLYSPAQGWGNPLEYAQVDMSEPGSDNLAKPPRIPDSRLPDSARAIRFPEGVRIEVLVTDRNGRIPFEGTTEDRWIEILKLVGFPSAEATVIRDSLMDWMDADQTSRPFGAEEQQYSSRRMGYSPPNRPLQTMEELGRILNARDFFFGESGIPNPQWEPFRELVGIRPAGEVNWNTAPKIFFQLQEEETGISAERIWSFLVGKDGIKGTYDDGILRPGVDMEDLPRDRNGNYPPVDRQVGMLEVKVITRRGDAEFLLVALLDPAERDAGGVYPLKIVELRENTERY